MAVGNLSPQDCFEHRRSRGTLIPFSMDRYQYPNVDRSPPRKRSTRRFQRNDEYDENPIHGKQRLAMVFGLVRILKRGEVLDEMTEVDFNETEKKQIRYSDSNVGETYAGLTYLDSPHPSSVPLPTFLVKRDDFMSDVNRRLDPGLDLQMNCQTDFFEILV